MVSRGMRAGDNWLRLNCGLLPRTWYGAHIDQAESRKPDNGTKVARSKRMSETAYAFPGEKKEPISDASHVRNAIARFNQVQGVTDSERDAAWTRIKTAAKKFGVEGKRRTLA